jgi:hypothetical protein
MTIQIANFDISDRSKVTGSGQVKLVPHRQDANHSGVFRLTVDVSFDPAVDDYPQGKVRINVDLSDSFEGRADSASIEQVNSFGKHTPTAVIAGRCRIKLTDGGTAPVGCRFWLLVADNRKKGEQGTPDVASFVIYDRNGNRVAYGTGPLEEGDIEVAPSGL